ncbi:hypothetical protein [Thiorhodospira sibirica]|uniref:hypothetical protein n=1 Tax=Thiorhodospira sibirica TaxID=154347 RepID=UPI00022C0548|nr:hypothetical protein [Thiorhodospira sibirica]
MHPANHTPALLHRQWLFPLLGGILLLCVSGLLLYLVGYFFYGAVIASSPAAAYATLPAHAPTSPTLEQDLIMLSATLRDLWWQQGFFIYLALFLLCFSLALLAQGRGLILALITALVLFWLLWRLQGSALAPGWVTASITLAGILNLLGAALVYGRSHGTFTSQHAEPAPSALPDEQRSPVLESGQSAQAPNVEPVHHANPPPARNPHAVWARLRQALDMPLRRQPAPAPPTPRLPPRLWTPDGLRDDHHTTPRAQPAFRHPYWQALRDHIQRLRTQCARVDWVDWALLTLALLSILGLIGVLTLAARF